MSTQLRFAGVIAQNTFRSLVRRKALLNILLLGVGLVLMAVVVSQISFGDPQRIVRSLALSGIGMALNLLAVLLGSSLVSEEVERRTLFAILTRPVARGTYLLGRLTGAGAVLALTSLGFFLVLVLVLAGVGTLVGTLDVVAVGFMWLEAWILLAFVMALSCYTNPLLASALGLGFWVICASIDDVRALLRAMDDPGFSLWLLESVAWVVPSFSLLNHREAAVYGDPTPVGALAAVTLSGVLYVAALWAIATWVLRQRQFAD